MKFTSIFFTTSEAIFEIILKYTVKRARKFVKRVGKNSFLHATSANNFGKAKYEVYFDIFHSKRKYIRDYSQIQYF